MKCITAERLRSAKLDDPLWGDTVEGVMWSLADIMTCQCGGWCDINSDAAEIAESLKYGGEDIP